MKALKPEETGFIVAKVLLAALVTFGPMFGLMYLAVPRLMAEQMPWASLTVGGLLIFAGFLGNGLLIRRIFRPGTARYPVYCSTGSTPFIFQ